MELKKHLSQYKGRRVFVTGHTGFKGTWLTSLLTELGAVVGGYSLSPTSSPNHFELLKGDLSSSTIADINDLKTLKSAVKNFAPDIVFHLAAQSLVKPSYEDPVETFATNAMGTVNVLEACREVESIEAIVCITTDKVYQNLEWPWGYRENDRLGGYDPYSASKACAELITNSYRQSFYSGEDTPLVASARAGNVVGGGDWCDYRIIPDVIRAITNKETLVIRNPQSIRPWQHVLDCLFGYLLLGERLLQKDKMYADAWNFGPLKNEFLPVRDIVQKAEAFWPNRFAVEYGQVSTQHHETNLLRLDSSKAVKYLSWRPILEDEVIFQWTFEWYKAFINKQEIITQKQVTQYLELVK